VGILTVNPIFLSDVTHVGRLNELTVIQNAKIHNQTGKIQLKRSQNGDKIVLRSYGQNQYFEVSKSDDIWITVNIIYGTLKVQIGKYLLKVARTRVSEWLLFNANSAIFQLYHGKKQGNFQWHDDGGEDKSSAVIKDKTELGLSAVLTHGHDGQLQWVPKSIGAHVNLYMLYTVCFFYV